MAGEKNMISPFEPDQIKSLAGNKVISYGTSSYGYDVRCSSNFKIFTNIIIFFLIIRLGFIKNILNNFIMSSL